MSEKQELENKCINTIRFLAADAIEKAKSGHPGMPLGAARRRIYSLDKTLESIIPKIRNGRIATGLYFPQDMRPCFCMHCFILRATNLSLEDIKNFRQWGSLTPGHPEFRHTAGVEVTTGPLGQGMANAVGMAIAEAHLAARFNREGATIIDHYTYVMAGDGDMMEGVTAEACALAGHLRLGKLIVLYDDNNVCLAGSTGLSFTEDLAMRFKAYDWHVQQVKDGNDVAAMDKAIKKAKKEAERPSLICIKSIIGCGAPHKQGSCDAHGAPLGADELKGAKLALGWPEESSFYIPEDVREYFRRALARGEKSEREWWKEFQKYKETDPQLSD